MAIITFHPTTTRADAIHSFFAYDPYISQFWLPMLGPTASWLIEELTYRSQISKDTFLMQATSLSRRIGTGSGSGQNCPVNKQLQRLVNTGIIFKLSEDEYMVPRTIQPLSPQMLMRLTEAQRIRHSKWMARLEANPLSTQKRRMKALLCRLEISGIETDKILEILHNSGLHPSVIGEMVLEASQHDDAA